MHQYSFPQSAGLTPRRSKEAKAHPYRLIASSMMSSAALTCFPSRVGRRDSCLTAIASCSENSDLWPSMLGIACFDSPSRVVVCRLLSRMKSSKTLMYLVSEYNNLDKLEYSNRVGFE